MFLHSGAGEREERLPRVCGLFLDHRVEQCAQHLPDRRTGQAERLDVVSIHREPAQRKAILRRQHAVQPVFDRMQPGDILRMRPLSDRVPFFDGQQVAEPGLPDLRQAAARLPAGIAQRAVVLFDQQQDAGRILARKTQAAQDTGRDFTVLFKSKFH